MAIKLWFGGDAQCTGFWAYIIRVAGELRITDAAGVKEYQLYANVEFLKKEWVQFDKPVRSFNELYENKDGFTDKTVLFWKGQKLQLKVSDLNKWVKTFTHLDFGEVFWLKTRYGLKDIHKALKEEEVSSDKRKRRMDELRVSEADIHLFSECVEDFLDDALERSIDGIWG